MIRPLAVHTFTFNHTYLSFRLGPNNWNLISPSPVDLPTDTVSAGAITRALTGKKGLVFRSSGVHTFVGNGAPDSAYAIVVTNTADGYNGAIDFWDSSHGAYWIDGAWYLLLTVQNYNSNTTSRTAMLKSDTYDANGIPITWIEMDKAHAPESYNGKFTSTCRWDGISTTIDCFCNVKPSASQTFYGLAQFDTSTGEWTGPYGVIDWGGTVLPTSFNSTDGNSIFKFPNGDVAVIYTYHTFDKLYYRVFSGISWGAEIVISTPPSGKSIYSGGMIPDIGKESLHVFELHDGAIGAVGVYHIVDHAGTVHSNLFTFPDRGGDAFGNPIIFDGQIIIPYDDFSKEYNSVWVGPITGGATTFVEEPLPVPASEAGGSPSTTYLLFGNFAGDKKCFPQYIKRANLLGH